MGNDDEGSLSSQEDLRRLTAGLHRFIEEERSRIAREVHDELGQCLTALKMDLRWIGKRVGDDAAVGERVEAAVGLVEEMTSAVRRISTELRPTILDDFGLAAAVEWQSEQFQSRVGIICHLQINDEKVDLSKSVSTAMFRVFQEVLTNIARHAEASSVVVRLDVEEASVSITIEDNGVGFEVNDELIRNSIGLTGMRERIKALGGTFEIQSRVGRGTTVRASLLLPAQDDESGRR